MKKIENVLCLPTADVFERCGRFTGIRFDTAAFAPFLAEIGAKLRTFMPRAKAETDPAFKQIIPFIVVFCDGLVLWYRRGKAGQENRLHWKRSLGVGGHINDSDPDYPTALAREFSEELGLPMQDILARMPKLAAVVNDESNPVGRVHLGFVYAIELSLEQRQKITAEDALVDPEFVAFEKLPADFETLESWSAFVAMEIGEIYKRRNQT